MPLTNAEKLRRCYAKKKKLAKGLIPITLWLYPAALKTIKGVVTTRLKLAKSKETRDNLEEILRELAKYEQS